MERIKNIKYLLRDLTVVRKKFEERERNQDNFNIFSILKKNLMRFVYIPGLFPLY